jgi:hypothetical protein
MHSFSIPKTITVGGYTYHAPRIRLRHFHTDDGRIALTVASMAKLFGEDLFYVGMALCDREDQPRREYGRVLAMERMRSVGDLAVEAPSWNFTGGVVLSSPQHSMLFWKLCDIEHGAPSQRKWGEYRRVFANPKRFVAR